MVEQSQEEKPLHGMHHRQIEEMDYMRKSYSGWKQLDWKTAGPDHGSTRGGYGHKSERSWDLSHYVRCRLSKEAPETTEHITVTGCMMLVAKASMMHHNQVAYNNIFAKLGLENSEFKIGHTSKGGGKWLLRSCRTSRYSLTNRWWWTSQELWWWTKWTRRM